MKKINYKKFLGGPSNLILLAFLVLLSIGGLSRLIDLKKNIDTISYSELVKNIKSNKVEALKISTSANGAEVFGKYKGTDRRFESLSPQNDSKLQNLAEEHDVTLSYDQSATADFSWWHVLMLLSLVLTPLGLWYFTRQTKSSGSSGSGGGIFSVGKSKARVIMPSQMKVNFDSVAGATEAKEELKEVVDFLKHPDKYRKLGAKLTKGALLVGEPGNGKTLLAKAVAGEANCPFYSISGADFMEVFVGVGASRVRDLFAQARKSAPSIIFIDEIDAIGKKRGGGSSGGHDEREHTLNQLLSEMDGFNTMDSSVVVMAATNRPDVLDNALLRPGRFDRQINVPYPDLASREGILKVHADQVKFDSSIDLKKIARGTPGFSGAQLAHLINEAAIQASGKSKDYVTIDELEIARDKIMLGKERKSLFRDKRELEMTAYHEAGHALMVLLQPEYADPLHKVTILARGSALGVTFSLPEKDKTSTSRNEMLADIRVALGGRIAEEIVYGDVTSGAFSDFQHSTEIARKMVTLYGMSESLGPVVYCSEASVWHKYSENTSYRIDEEVRSVVNKLYAETRDMLKANRDKLDILVKHLLDKETLQAEEVYEILGVQPRQVHSLT